ncbi:MAG: aconitase X catalytic domain-containing protein [Proteobacteria bacterium]|nr:aconitase X catalytic domain-containing protein [Pseudomonadota bacterium]
MHLSDVEKSMLGGDRGEPRRRAIEHQIKVGRFFDAPDMVEIAQAHIMADTEALGGANVAYLEDIARFAEEERRVAVPTITDPRGADLKQYKSIRQDEAFIDLERRTIAAFKALGVMMTDTCINYQLFMPPVLGQHMAFGDTGVCIYCNSVLGARTNYEGGPSALAAALTGRTPRYGFHLDKHRRGTALFEIRDQPKSLTDWGALGGIVGREMGSYFEVPVLDGITSAPTSDDMKHFGAALASFGSTPLFHIIGVTPEAPDLKSVFDDASPRPTPVKASDIEKFYGDYGASDDQLDVVVFAAPQLSLIELQSLAGLLDGRHVDANVALLICTAPAFKAEADRMGFTHKIEKSGALLLEGVCFYNMHARELGEANGWQRLMTNSAKLTNILSGYGYEPVLGAMEACVESAIAGRIIR